MISPALMGLKIIHMIQKVLCLNDFPLRHFPVVSNQFMKSFLGSFISFLNETDQQSHLNVLTKIVDMGFKIIIK